MVHNDYITVIYGEHFISNILYLYSSLCKDQHDDPMAVCSYFTLI